MAVPESSLYNAICHGAGLRSTLPTDTFTSSLSPILFILGWIKYLPIQHRKAVLDTCRIQASILSNSTLKNSFASLAPVHAVTRTFEGTLTSTILTVPELISFLDMITPFPILCTILSYFTRAESTVHIEQFSEQKTIALNKELSAALWYQTQEQVLDYRQPLFGFGGGNLHHQIAGQGSSRRLRSLYERGLQQISNHFASLSTMPILPKYNTRKNVSYETIRNYYDLVGSDEHNLSRFSADITTLDLLRYYYITGCQVNGPIEMRLAWFFNDLKPRIYYCLGGTDFWEGCFIQDIANIVCKLLPCTHPHSRFTISRVGSLSYDELLITYDYSSFTTSLSELKYFLFWLARATEGVVVQVLDVHTGVKEMSLSSILDTYNDAVNRHQVFSVERFAEGEQQYELRQGRSGSLGVKGNIVFSTSLHGLALSDITGTPDDDCCVGDDALARIRAYTVSMFITCVNNLGEINTDKFTTILRPQEDESFQVTQFKFLKRPLWVDHDGKPNIGRLDFFPSIADVLFPLGDGVHTARPSYSAYGSARTFAMQVGRYLSMQTESSIIIARDEDLEFVLSAFKMAYQHLGLPISGGIPGDYVVREEVAYFYCPPIDTLDVFSTHWMQVLLHRMFGRWTHIPITVGGTIPPPLSLVEGQTFTSSSDVEFLQLCVDLRVLDKKVETRMVRFDWEVLAGMEDLLSSRVEQRDVEPLCCTFTCISPPPLWWYDLAQYYYPQSVYEDPKEAWERISTIMSGSSI